MQALIRTIPVSHGVTSAIIELVRGARPETPAWPELRSELSWGPGPRAGQALMLAVRARALIDQRLSPSVEDIAALALPCLRHRMALAFAAGAAGGSLDAILQRLVARL